MSKLGRFVFGFLILLIPLIVSGQQDDSISIVLPDTVRLNPAYQDIAQFRPPPIYQEWLKRIAVCEDLQIPPKDELDKLNFYLVNHENFRQDTLSVAADAILYARKHLILIRIASVYDYQVVAHEFLHFLLWYTYGNKYQPPNEVHPYKYFGKCNIRPN